MYFNYSNIACMVIYRPMVSFYSLVDSVMYSSNAVEWDTSFEKSITTINNPVCEVHGICFCSACIRTYKENFGKTVLVKMEGPTGQNGRRLSQKFC